MKPAKPFGLRGKIEELRDMASTRKNHETCSSICTCKVAEDWTALAAATGAERGLLWGMVFDRCSKRLAVVVWHRMGWLRNKMTVEDVLQEVYKAAWLKVDSFSASAVGGPYPWILGITYHVLSKLKRHYARRITEQSLSAVKRNGDSSTPRELGDGIDAAASRASERAMNHEATLRFIEILDGLEKEVRDVLVWKLFEGCSHEEIAERCESTTESVRQRFWRAKQLLLEGARVLRANDAM